MADQDRRAEQAFALAQARYAEMGVDVEQALARLSGVAVSLHCWQGDDVGGVFREPDRGLAHGGSPPAFPPV